MRNNAQQINDVHVDYLGYISLVWYRDIYLTGILIVKQVSAGELELINMTDALSSEVITHVHMCDNIGRVFTFHRRSFWLTT